MEPVDWSPLFSRPYEQDLWVFDVIWKMKTARDADRDKQLSVVHLTCMLKPISIIAIIHCTYNACNIASIYNVISASFYLIAASSVSVTA